MKKNKVGPEGRAATGCAKRNGDSSNSHLHLDVATDTWRRSSGGLAQNQCGPQGGDRWSKANTATGHNRVAATQSAVAKCVGGGAAGTSGDRTCLHLEMGRLPTPATEAAKP